MVKHYVGARYVPKFASPVEWAANTSYEALTIVTFNNASYTSKVQVPPTVGNPADNPQYWALTGNYNAQIEEYRQITAQVQSGLNQEITDRTNADTALQTAIEELDTVTPEMYGAVGDGTTDDITAIQNAINSGKYVIFDPNKNYLISSSIVLNNATNYLEKKQSVNFNNTTITYTGTDFAIRIGDTTTSDNNNRDIQYIANCRIYARNGSGIHVSQWSSYVFIAYCSVYALNIGIQIADDNSSSTGVRIDKCIIEINPRLNTGSIGINIFGLDNVVSDTLVYFAATEIYLHGAGNYFNSIHSLGSSPFTSYMFRDESNGDNWFNDIYCDTDSQMFYSSEGHTGTDYVYNFYAHNYATVQNAALFNALKSFNVNGGKVTSANRAAGSTIGLANGLLTNKYAQQYAGCDFKNINVNPDILVNAGDPIRASKRQNVYYDQSIIGNLRIGYVTGYSNTTAFTIKVNTGTRYGIIMCVTSTSYFNARIIGGNLTSSTISLYKKYITPSSNKMSTMEIVLAINASEFNAVIEIENVGFGFVSPIYNPYTLHDYPVISDVSKYTAATMS